MQAEMGGPVLWFLYIIMFGSALLSAYVIIDSFRPARAERLASGAGRLIWVGPQVVYLAAVLASLLPAVPRSIASITLAAAPLAIILAVSYLLKIAYPKPEDDSAPSEPAEPQTAKGDATP